METAIFYSKCFLGVLIGLIIHTGLKFKSVKALYTKSNETFTFVNFLRMELASHIVNFFCCLAWMLLLSDVLKIYPKIELYLVSISILVGYANSSLVIYALGASTAKIMKIIDQKTNIADNKELLSK